MKLPKFFGKPRRNKRVFIRRVAGESMLPALKPGQIIFALKTRKIRPGDIVIIQHNGLEKTKRVKYVQDDKVFVLGDNPVKSTDSRAFGLIARENILAKVTWPAS